MKHSATISPAFLAAVCFLAFPGFAFSQSLSNPRALGVVVYKKHGFLPDKDAVAYEYSSWHDRAGVMRFTTLRGTRVTVHPSSDVFLVPYPGRSFDDKEDALLLIDFAGKRYPQYSALWKNLKTAWNNPRRRPPSAADAQTAKSNEEKAGEFRESLQNRQRDPGGSNQGASTGGSPDSPPSRGEHGGPSASRDEVPRDSGEDAADPADTGGNRDSEDSSNDLLEKSLELIRTYYKTVGEMSR